MTPSEAPRDVVVIGGGIAGLTAAYALQERRRRQSGIEVILVDAARRLGGKILTERVNGFTVEAGPDSFVASGLMVDLCDRLGLRDALVTTDAQARTVYVLHRGRLHPIPAGLALVVPLRMMPLVRSGLFSFWEKARMGLDLLRPAAPPRGDESLGAVIRRRFGPAAVERLAGPLLGGIYAGGIDRLSVRATFPQLADAERRHGSLILGMRAQRSDGAAGETSRASTFLTLKGGLNTLVDRLAGALTDTEVLTGSPVRAIVRADRARYAVHLDHRVLTADAIVLATPAPVAADLMHAVAPEATRLLPQIPYTSIAVVALGYRRSEIACSLNGHGFVVSRNERCHISACTWVSSKWPASAPPNHVLLRCYLGRVGDESVLDLSDEAITGLVGEELRTILGITAEPCLSRVYRWKAAMPQYLVGHLQRIAAIEQVMATAPGMVLAGAAYRGIGIPQCVRQGLEAADLAAGQR